MILNWLFGCSHENTTWPQTVKRRHEGKTYIVCFDCMQELEYDFDDMKIVGEVKVPIVREWVDIGEVRRREA